MAPVLAPETGRATLPGAQPTAFVTMMVSGQLFGIPVSAVRDILREQPINRVPLAPPEIAGSLNLRGRIVTAIDLRRKLSLPPSQAAAMSVVTEHDGEFYALLVDQVCEVLNPDSASFELNPPTLPHAWAQYCLGLYRLSDKLMLVLDLSRLLAISPQLGFGTSRMEEAR